MEPSEVPEGVVGELGRRDAQLMLQLPNGRVFRAWDLTGRDPLGGVQLWGCLVQELVAAARVGPYLSERHLAANRMAADVGGPTREVVRGSGAGIVK